MAISSTQKGQHKPLVQSELFSASIAECPVKDDLASMEFPLFSLAKKPDTKIREYQSPTTKKWVRVTPSVLGAATVFDKDLLLYIGSQIIEGRQSGLAVSRVVKVDTYAFFASTARDPGGNAYKNIMNMLRRLNGTRIETNIVTGGKVQTKAFGWIEEYDVTYGKTGKGVLEVIVKVSEWLYNALLHYEVLTIDRSYYQLGQALERRLYELARKHAGEKVLWKCDIEILRQKCGSTQTLRHFRAEVRQMIRRDVLPDYRIALDTSSQPQRVVFYSRDPHRLAQELQRIDGHAWFEQLERQSNLVAAGVQSK